MSLLSGADTSASSAYADSLEHELSFKTSERTITARLTGLQTETTYRCVLETGNEYSTITGDTLRFTTAQGAVRQG